MKIYKQETSKSCGIACLRSIFNHLGNNFSEEDIWSKNNSFQSKTSGILNPLICLGVTALKFKFEVTYIGYNPLITNNNTSSILKKSLEEKSKNYFDYGKFYIDESLKFLELGGKLNIDKLNVKKIKKIIDEEKFILVEIKPAFFNKRVFINMNHKVIIAGYDKKGFRILDPSNACESIIDFDTFMIAFYAAIPEILIIKENK